MARFAFAAIFLIVSLTAGLAHAITEHNGIRWDMSQMDVEAKGYVCRPHESYPTEQTTCKHMDVTGVAFGYPTRDYEVFVRSATKQVSCVAATLVGMNSLADYNELVDQTKHF